MTLVRDVECKAQSEIQFTGVSFLGATDQEPLLTAGYHPRLPPGLPGSWRLFQPGFLHFYFLQTDGTNPCSWSVYAQSNRAAYLSFTQNSLMDSGSPLAIKRITHSLSVNGCFFLRCTKYSCRACATY